MNMTDEQILAAAEATGLKLITLGLDKQKSEFFILAFAKFVAAKEREACAKLVKDYMKETAIMEARGCLASVAYDIRARGEQE